MNACLFFVMGYLIVQMLADLEGVIAGFESKGVVAIAVVVIALAAENNNTSFQFECMSIPSYGHFDIKALCL